MLTARLSTQRFGTFGRLKQVALRAIAHNFGADGELLAEMRDMFNAIDTDGSGTITHEEMEKVLSTYHGASCCCLMSHDQ